LGGSLLAGERVVPEEDRELSRHGTEPHLQVYSYFFAPSVVVLAYTRLISIMNERGEDNK